MPRPRQHRRFRFGCGPSRQYQPGSGFPEGARRLVEILAAVPILWVLLGVPSRCLRRTGLDLARRGWLGWRIEIGKVLYFAAKPSPMRLAKAERMELTQKKLMRRPM